MGHLRWSPWTSLLFLRPWTKYLLVLCRTYDMRWSPWVSWLFYHCGLLGVLLKLPYVSYETGGYPKDWKWATLNSSLSTFYFYMSINCTDWINKILFFVWACTLTLVGLAPSPLLRVKGSGASSVGLCPHLLWFLCLANLTAGSHWDFFLLFTNHRYSYFSPREALLWLIMFYMSK